MYFVERPETKNPRHHQDVRGLLVFLGTSRNLILAEKGGFEPPVGINLRTLSRRVT